MWANKYLNKDINRDTNIYAFAVPFIGGKKDWRKIRYLYNLSSMWYVSLSESQ